MVDGGLMVPMVLVYETFLVLYDPVFHTLFIGTPVLLYIYTYLITCLLLFIYPFREHIFFRLIAYNY